MIGQEKAFLFGIVTAIAVVLFTNWVCGYSPFVQTHIVNGVCFLGRFK